LHITLETDYAIRITDVLAKAYLADSGHCRVDAAAISEKTAVPVRFALKILRRLTAGGVVRSFQGAKGGYELAKPPGELSLLDVVELTQGDYQFSRCLGGEYTCSHMAASQPDESQDESRDESPDSKHEEKHCACLPCCYQFAFAEVTGAVRDILKKHRFG
jgi:Rrf2 family protein